MENTISIPRGASYSCPQCGKHTVRKQKGGLTKVKYRCYTCYWAGDAPSVERKFVTRSNSIVVSVKYEDIIKNLLTGATIQEQLLKFDAFETKKSQSAASGRKNAIRNKVLRVYNAYSEYTGIPCIDPDFVKMKITEDVLQLLISGIEDEETKIRNSPRLSVSFSK